MCRVATDGFHNALRHLPTSMAEPAGSQPMIGNPDALMPAIKPTSPT